MRNGNIVDSTQADINGYYQFNKLLNGGYNIIATTHKIWSGVNATDAVKVKLHFAGSELLTSSLRLHSADVNISFTINTTDAVKITRRFVGADSSFVRGDWLFEKPFGGDTLGVSVYMNDTIIVNGNNVSQNFKGLCVGDVNGSNLPLIGAKSNPKINLDFIDFIKLNSNESFEIPIMPTKDITISALSMILNFPKDLVTINNVQLLILNDERTKINEVNNLVYRILDNELRIGWFANENALNLKINTPFITIRGKTTGIFKYGDIIKFSFANNPLNEIADESGNPVEDFKLATNYIEHINSPKFEEPANKEVKIYPNPANNILYIEIAVNSVISIYNLLGELIFCKQLSSNLYSINLTGYPESTYILKVTSDKELFTKKIVVIKH